MIPIVYSPIYNITAWGLERFHPFDGRKYGRIQRWLVQQGVRQAHDFVPPPPLTDEELRSVHSADYLHALRRREVLFNILEVSVVRCLPAWVTQWRVLWPMRLSASGTVHAARLALEHGFAINLGGGYHHAYPDRGSGFCVYADIPLALRLLQQEGRIQRALVIDIDAHQGDGIAASVRPWPWAHIVDFFENALFPWPKQEEEMPVPLASGLTGPDYLAILGEHVPVALDRFQPDLVICNAGSDVLASDPITGLNLTIADMVQRDLYVTQEVRRRGIPMALTLSGGYGPESWLAHARSIASLLGQYDPQPRTALRVR
jgi:histone deacetylase 11